MNRITDILDKITEISLYCLIFIIPFSKAGIEIFAITAISCWVLRKLLSFKCKAHEGDIFPSTPLNLPIFTLFFVHIISAFFSSHVMLGLESIITKLGEYILLFFVCADTFSKKEGGNKRFVILSAVVAASALLLFADGLFQWLTGKDFIRGFSATPRLKASFSNENDFAGYLIAVLPVLFCLIFIALDRIKKNALLVFKAVLALLFITGLFLLAKTFGRGAWLGYVVSMIFLGLASFWCNRRNIAGTGAAATKPFFIIVLFFVLTPLIAGSLFAGPIKRRLVGPSGSFGIIARTYQWEKAADMIEDFPLFGTGPNSYTAINAYYEKSGATGGYPHNSYLHMAVETGIIGLGVFLWVLWRFFYIGLKNIRSALAEYDWNNILAIFGIMAGVLATLTQSFFDTNLFALRLIILFWIMLGAGASVFLNVSNRRLLN